LDLVGDAERRWSGWALTADSEVLGKCAVVAIFVMFYKNLSAEMKEYLLLDIMTLLFLVDLFKTSELSSSLIHTHYRKGSRRGVE